MFIVNLFESNIEESGAQIVVLYPGRFQPFHLGHKEVFRALQNKFGRDNVFISTSNKTEIPKSPFNFSDKFKFMIAAGVPADRILEVASPYKLPAQFDPENTIFIVAVGAPDADRLKPNSVKKDGNPSYFKSFTNIKGATTADKHGYVIIADERNKVITIGNDQVDVSHGTQSRAAWNAVRKNPKGRSQFLLQMYGRDDPELGRILDKIPAELSENLEADPELARTVDYAVGHYPNVKDRGEAFMKFVQRSLKHGLETDVDQQQKINDLTKEINDIKRSISQKKLSEEAAGVGVVSNSKDPRYVMATMGDQNDVTAATLPKMMAGYHLNKKYKKLKEEIDTLKEKWSAKYKRSINCNSPKGFSQRAHCQGRKKS